MTNDPAGHSWPWDVPASSPYDSVQPVRYTPDPTRGFLDRIEDEQEFLGRRLFVIGRDVDTWDPDVVLDLVALDIDRRVHAISVIDGDATEDDIDLFCSSDLFLSSLLEMEQATTFLQYRPGYRLEEAFTEAFGVPMPAARPWEYSQLMIASGLDANAQQQLSLPSDDDVRLELFVTWPDAAGDGEGLCLERVFPLNGGPMPRPAA